GEPAALVDEEETPVVRHARRRERQRRTLDDPHALHRRRRQRCDDGGGQGSAGPSSSSTSNDQISLPVPTGPPERCCAWPAAKSGPLTHAMKSSSERQRVSTRHTSRSSLGRSSSKASKPSALDTFPAREANLRSNSSK